MQISVVHGFKKSDQVCTCPCHAALADTTPTQGSGQSVPEPRGVRVRPQLQELCHGVWHPNMAALTLPMLTDEQPGPAHAADALRPGQRLLPVVAPPAPRAAHVEHVARAAAPADAARAAAAPQAPHVDHAAPAAAAAAAAAASAPRATHVQHAAPADAAPADAAPAPVSTPASAAASQIDAARGRAASRSAAAVAGVAAGRVAHVQIHYTVCFQIIRNLETMHD